MPADRLEQAKLRRDIALLEYWSALYSPQGDAFGRREARMDKAQEDIAEAEAEMRRVRKQRELVRLWREMQAKNDSGHPVVGSVPAQAPKPYAPHEVEPQAFDPAETVEQWSPSAGSSIVHDLPETRKGAQHVTDPNPVEWRHVFALMESNFPDSALEWVKHSTWQGPVNIPWSRVDDDDIDSWAASHQADAVNRFAREIARGGKHTEPAILVHQANHSDGREIIIDGHHRSLARHFKLGKPVLAYVGTVPARWMQQALETHSSQLHQGDDPANR